jgi:hypothetical protein
MCCKKDFSVINLIYSGQQLFSYKYVYFVSFLFKNYSCNLQIFTKNWSHGQTEDNSTKPELSFQLKPRPCLCNLCFSPVSQANIT